MIDHSLRSASTAKAHSEDVHHMSIDVGCRGSRAPIQPRRQRGRKQLGANHEPDTVFSTNPNSSPAVDARLQATRKPTAPPQANASYTLEILTRKTFAPQQ